MIFAIFLVAALLLLGGVLGLVSALNLIPTDLGLVHFEAGTTAFVAGLVTLAIGFSTRALVAALRRVATPHALAAASDERPRMPEPVIEPPLRAGREPAIAAGMLAAGAAAGAAFAAPAAPEPAGEPLSPAFAEIPVDPNPAFDLPPVAFSEALDLGAPAGAPEEGPVALPAEPPVERLAEPELPLAPTVLPGLSPIPAPPDLMLQAIPEPPVLSIEQEIRAQLGRVPAPESEPPVEPESEPPVEPESAPVHGPIPDADWAILDEGSPPLAPLETLEIVGAYDSGGTRFTMYSDGSVVAAGPDGEIRYPTLQDLRRHLDQLSG